MDSTKIDLIIEQFFQQFGIPGQLMIVKHLRSEKGKVLNGRRAVIVGVDHRSKGIDRRVQVRLLDPNETNKPVGKVLQLKPRNLVAPEDNCSAVTHPTLSKKLAASFLNTAWKAGLEIGHGRLPSDPDEARDRYKRTMLIKEYIPDRLPPPIECMDLLAPMKEQTEYEQMKSMMTPGCVGDGYVDFTRFGEGILGGNEECAICQDDMESNIVSLPCGHRFHVDCVQPWITEHNTCPTCRKELQHSLEVYIFEVSHEQVRKRFDEWFITGMCERCQAVYLEKNPVVQVTRDDGMEVTMPLSVAKLNGYTNFKSVQGQISQTVNVPL